MSYYCHSYLIPNYKARNPILATKKRKDNVSKLCNICILASAKWIYKLYQILLDI